MRAGWSCVGGIVARLLYARLLGMLLDWLSCLEFVASMGWFFACCFVVDEPIADGRAAPVAGLVAPSRVSA